MTSGDNYYTNNNCVSLETDRFHGGQNTAGYVMHQMVHNYRAISTAESTVVVFDDIQCSIEVFVVFVVIQCSIEVFDVIQCSIEVFDVIQCSIEIFDVIQCSIEVFVIFSVFDRDFCCYSVFDRGFLMLCVRTCRRY